MKKYDDLRAGIKTGDIVLFRGHSLLSKGIQWVDKSYFNHAGIAYWVEDRLFVIDATSEGVKLESMSVRIKGYDDFAIIRVISFNTEEMKNAISNLFHRIEADTTYGYAEFLRVFIYRKFGTDAPWIPMHGQPICSELARDFLVDAGVVSQSKITLPTPQDLVRYLDKDLCQLMFDIEPIK
jgi:hypothetical protein